jgi:integrase
MSTKKLPEGIRRRGKRNHLYAYLTFPDGKFELRSCRNLTPAQAKKVRRKWQNEIDEGRYLKPVPRTDQVLLSTLCDNAKEWYGSYRRGWDSITTRIKVFKEWWPDVTAESITPEEIDGKLLSMVKRKEKPWTKTTSNEYRITLIRVYAIGIKQKKVKANPALLSERYKLENARDEVLSYAQEDALRAVIEKQYQHKMPEFDLALHLGCRRSNLYGQHRSRREVMQPLQWEDVNLDFRVVKFIRSKSGKPYTVPLNDHALAAFKVLKARATKNEKDKPTGPVIRKASGITLHSSRKWFEKSLAEAKIKNFRWHDLRHTFGTRLRDAGVHLEDIGYLLGHGSKSITERYAAPSPTVLRAAVANLDVRHTVTDEVNIVPFSQVAASR